MHGLPDHGIVVLDALRVADNRYWSYCCFDPECCADEGTPFDISTSAVAAAATVAGLVALPDRQALIRQVAPVGGVTRLSMRQATERADKRLLDLVEAAGGEVDGELSTSDDPWVVAQADAAVVRQTAAEGELALAEAVERHRSGGRLTDDEAAWLTVLVAIISIRDVALEDILDSAGDRQAHYDLWLDLTRRAEADLVSAPGTLFALCAWAAGDGALASVAVERVLRLDPDYSLAHLVQRGMATGLLPDDLFADDKFFAGFDTVAPGAPVRARSAQRRRRRSSSRRVRTQRG
jgi:hypothetical protein